MVLIKIKKEVNRKTPNFESGVCDAVSHTFSIVQFLKIKGLFRAASFLLPLHANCNRRIYTTNKMVHIYNKRRVAYHALFT